MRATVIKTAARSLLSRIARDDTGATSIEYAILIGMMALICIASFSAVGGSSGGRWGSMANAVITAMTTK